MIEFEIDGRQFRLLKPNAIDQLHISRKIAPLLPPLAPAVSQVLKLMESGKITLSVPAGEEENAMKTASDLLPYAGLLQEFTDALASMKNEDAEFVFDKCLNCVQVNTDRGWVKFWSSQAKGPMMDTMNDPSLMLRLTLRVIADSLGNFLKGFLTVTKEPEPIVLT